MDLPTEISPELYAAVRAHYEAGEYSLAILDGMRVLTKAIRDKTGLDGDGAALVGQALGGNSPPLQLNVMRTTSQVDEQRGHEQIIRGLYTGIRNPAAT
jgi:uncharacterized protein (TIGR02391 family)